MDQENLNSLELFEKEFDSSEEDNKKEFFDFKTKKFSIVVSRYKENIEWLEKYSLRDDIYAIYVYDKSDDEKGSDDCKEMIKKLYSSFLPRKTKIFYEKLPNIGRESHTYLYHIVKHYESFITPKTIFCQGYPFDHVQDFDSLFICENGKSSPFYQIPGDSPHNSYDFRLTSHGGENIVVQNEDNLCLGDWLKKNVFCGDETDRIFSFGLENIFSSGKYRLLCGANFCISRKNIVWRDKSYYEHLLSLLKDKSCETGHFFKRAWYYIFKIYLF